MGRLRKEQVEVSVPTPAENLGGSDESECRERAGGRDVKGSAHRGQENCGTYQGRDNRQRGTKERREAVSRGGR